jgi:dihydroorotase
MTNDAGGGQRTAYLNARLLNPASGLDEPGALLTEGGTIAELGPRLFADGAPDGVSVVDCHGLCLSPGLIDCRVFLGEPGAEHKETIATGSHAAAAGGVTTIIAAPNTDPVIDNPALVEFVIRQAQDTAAVNVLPMAAITKGCAGAEMAEMGLLAEAGAVAFTDGHRSIGDAGMMRRALAYASTFDLLIAHHTEEPTLAAGGCINEGEIATRLGLAGIPTAAETIMVERDLRLVELTHARYHAAGLSTASAIAAIRRAKDKGLAVTCAVAPHHFALNELGVGDYRTFAKLSPPLRSEDDRQAMVEGLKDGTIDVISSAHTPEDTESKRQPFARAAHGTVGVETLLPIALELCHGGHLSLLEVIGLLTVRPAELLGLACGRLERGAPADLLLFDPETPWRIDAEALRSKAKNSAFDGHPVQGRAVRTIVAGATVYTTSDAP